MHVTSTVPLHTRSAPTRTLAARSHIRQAPRSPQVNNMGSRKHITKTRQRNRIRLLRRRGAKALDVGLDTKCKEYEVVTGGLEAETLISMSDCSGVVAAVNFLCKRGKRWKCAKRAHQINTNSKSNQNGSDEFYSTRQIQRP